MHLSEYDGVPKRMPSLFQKDESMVRVGQWTIVEGSGSISRSSMREGVDQYFVDKALAGIIVRDEVVSVRSEVGEYVFHIKLYSPASLASANVVDFLRF